MRVDDVIRRRATLKVMADPSAPLAGLAESDSACLIDELLQLAEWAPYHYPCHPVHQVAPFDSPMPWRCVGMTSQGCRRLLSELSNRSLELGKIAGMLAAADALLMLTWLPDPDSESASAVHSDDRLAFAPSRRNMEHIAAASAAAQNVLLAGTARGYSTYWSSGGALRSAEVFRVLQIPLSQILLGALFVFPNELGDVETKTGAHRDSRGSHGKWSRIAFR